MTHYYRACCRAAPASSEIPSTLVNQWNRKKFNSIGALEVNPTRERCWLLDFCKRRTFIWLVLERCRHRSLTGTLGLEPLTSELAEWFPGGSFSRRWIVSSAKQTATHRKASTATTRIRPHDNTRYESEDTKIGSLTWRRRTETKLVLYSWGRCLFFEVSPLDFFVERLDAISKRRFRTNE